MLRMALAGNRGKGSSPIRRQPVAAPPTPALEQIAGSRWVQVQEQEREQEQEPQASWLTLACIARPATPTTPLLPLARLHPWCIGLSTVMEIDGEALSSVVYAPSSLPPRVPQSVSFLACCPVPDV